MSLISFDPRPLSELMPSYIQTSQTLVREHLAEAGLQELAQLGTNGRIAEQFDQYTLAEKFESLVQRARGAMKDDVKAGRQLVRVQSRDRLDCFQVGALDPATVHRSSTYWTSVMASDPAVAAVWGIGYPVLSYYLDGSVGWENHFEAIVVVSGDCRWAAVRRVKGLTAVGSSSDAPCWSWAGQLQNATKELTEIFAPFLWRGGRSAKWEWRPAGRRRPDSFSPLNGEDRTRLLIALSHAGVAERVVTLQRPEVSICAGGQV